jgi:transcription initiation factor TFIIH subunit 1
MDVDGDENSVTTYEKVLHKKVGGKLILSGASLTFETAPAIAWIDVKKHQVSPINYPKALLKLILNNGKSNTYQLPSREELERIRKDINARLQSARSVATLSGKKRPFGETSPSKRVTSTSFGELDPTALAVTRSSLLAANPGFRAQHHYLVQETQTLSEDDFWKTHNDLLEEEYARISGMTKAGSSSLLQSHLQLLTGRVTLGVEEMRQIFILYPAVHKAYEEKVPLELSDEQFWRKYLESEYFHRDRGRLGAASRQGKSDDKKQAGQKLSQEDQEARAAAVGTDDIFSRYDQKLREVSRNDDSSTRRRWGTKLAIGQFDLASTFETERGQLLEGPRDNHPSNSDDIKGSQVIQKYNRHWAMVMHPEDATAGSDLMQVARQSVDDVLPGDNDANAHGGVDEEMVRLVAFAQSSSNEANHAIGIGLAESEEYERLTLKNIEAYYSYRPSQVSKVDDEETRKRNGLFANAMLVKQKAMAAAARNANHQGGLDVGSRPLEDAFPPPLLAKELLAALTNKMEQDSRTDEDALAIVSNLPEDFKKRLHSYFRRSSELLRHFFGLRKLAEAAQGTPDVHAYTQKQRRIVTGMETVYREIEEIRKELEATGETGTLMRKMYLQIMEQLNWVFKLNREGAGGGGGGFVTMESF